MVIIKKRKLDINKMTCSGCEQKIKKALQELKGIKNIKADYKIGELKLEYNLLEITLKDIEPEIVNLGYLLPDGFFNKLKRGVTHYKEETERDNYLAKSTPCCSNPDEIINKSKHKPK